MANKIALSVRVSPDDQRDLLNLGQLTGKTSSELLNEAIALYLKKVVRLNVESRLSVAEQSIVKLQKIVLLPNRVVIHNKQPRSPESLPGNPPPESQARG
jgi:predicted DNA-binding protein